MSLVISIFSNLFHSNSGGFQVKFTHTFTHTHTHMHTWGEDYNFVVGYVPLWNKLKLSKNRQVNSQLKLFIFGKQHDTGI